MAEARVAWPDIGVSLDRFTEFLQGKENATPERAADLYLACGCAAGTPKALAAFDQAFAPVIERALATSGATAAERTELVQIVRTRLLVAEPGSTPRIATYTGKGALKSWLKVIAAREAARLLPKVRRELSADDDDLAGAIAPDSGAALAFMKAAYREHFKAAFHAAVAALSDRERVLLRQHELDGLSIDELAAFYRVHRATTARWIQAARAAVLEGTREHLAERLRTSKSEIDSIMRLIRSNLDISLPSLLRTARIKPGLRAGRPRRT